MIDFYFPKMSWGLNSAAVNYGYGILPSYNTFSTRMQKAIGFFNEYPEHVMYYTRPNLSKLNHPELSEAVQRKQPIGENVLKHWRERPVNIPHREIDDGSLPRPERVDKSRGGKRIRGGCGACRAHARRMREAELRKRFEGIKDLEGGFDFGPLQATFDKIGGDIANQGMNALITIAKMFGKKITDLLSNPTALMQKIEAYFPRLKAGFMKFFHIKTKDEIEKEKTDAANSKAEFIKKGKAALKKYMKMIKKKDPEQYEHIQGIIEKTKTMSAKKRADIMNRLFRQAMAYFNDEYNMDDDDEDDMLNVD